ncbi:Zn(2)-C6 fungal-type domain-containing protein [Mycena venus]|uniref:Zn(2)-C6 fungal-type domain-containing protein n=1 Tax=Mycena venus TaxID=2733690 RepID=A0A8H7DBG7_9AGAR|nr:Zn(2)-C6 fungal-type domain-containing protein [Mycena venus]
MLVKTAVDVKKDNEQSSMRRQTPPLLKPWALKPWESRHWIPPHTWTFPDNSLMESLVSLYFLNVNCFIPVLHRPIFEECLKHRLHMSHPGFGTVVLLVCALGSLYLTGPDPTKVDRETMAWKWYNQVEMCGHFLCQLPTLYDLQAYCLAAQFLHCTSNPRFAWIIVGFALRLVQDVALHRGKPRGPTITADEELEKRALWTLLFLDTQISGFLGRYAALDVVEIDISLPCECDDDYWRSSGPGFQPPDKPSVLAFFNCLLQLYRIFHFTIRSLYTTRASHLRSRTINDLPDIAMELDSALDKWFCTIPEHLLWNQDQSSSLFFDQSAVLNCFYCYTRILINRPSIPGLFSMPPPSFENPIALEICVEAARSCIEVADTHRQRRSDSCYPLFFSQGPVFTAATILIIGHWSHSNEQPEAIDDLALVRTAINIFHTQQERWPSSEFYATVLERLISIEGNSQAQLDYHNSLPVQPDLHTSSDWIRGHSALSRVTAPIWTEGQMVDEEALDDAPQVAIPPAFVGDEEIIPRQARRPRVIG